MVSKNTKNRLSLRCKFKDAKTVEVTVINHEDMITYQILWNYEDEKSKPVVVSEELTLK